MTDTRDTSASPPSNDLDQLQAVTDECVARGICAFPSVAVMCAAFQISGVTAQHVTSWRRRRVVVDSTELREHATAAASRDNEPVKDESSSASFLVGMHLRAKRSVGSTLQLGKQFVGTAVGWGAWLVNPALQRLVASIPARRAILQSHNKDTTTNHAPQAPIPLASEVVTLNRFGSPTAPGSPSAVDLGALHEIAAIPDLGEQPLPPGVFVVFRPALHRLAATVIQSVISDVDVYGACQQVLTSKEWGTKVVEELGITSFEPVSDFLALHVGAIELVESSTPPIGTGVCLAFVRSDVADTTDQGYTEETGGLAPHKDLLRFKLLAEALDDAMLHWEDDLRRLTLLVASSEDVLAPDDVLQRMETLRGLIAANKLVHIEVTKTLQRAKTARLMTISAVMHYIQGRLQHFDDLDQYPILVLPSSTAPSAA